MKKKEFCIYPRKLKNGKTIYYYATYDNDGKRKHYSTGQTEETKAYKYCLDKLSSGELIKNAQMTFENYTEKWFVWNECPYYTIRQNRGRFFSRSQFEQKRSILDNHIIPYFGKKKLYEITTRNIENWLILKKNRNYSNNSINHYLTVLKLILSEAERLGYIKNNPAVRVVNFSDISKEKGILTKSETNNLFSPTSIDIIWNGNKMHYLLNKIACQTGMRMGEIIALQSEDINIEENYIRVSHSWDRKYGLKSTKNGKIREVPISEDLSHELKFWIRARNTTYIFMHQGSAKPIDHKTVRKYFIRALDHIGINEATRKQRNITFHSYRHTANTRFRSFGLPDSIIRSFIGHSTTEMTDHYSHLSVNDLNIDLNLLYN